MMRPGLHTRTAPLLVVDIGRTRRHLSSFFENSVLGTRLFEPKQDFHSIVFPSLSPFSFFFILPSRITVHASRIRWLWVVRCWMFERFIPQVSLPSADA